ncbi:AAA family ATPase [Roseateles toxinivorans]|uniref:DNA repair exonuclease SbcCD ATPase subunit n=1 Tax=Roseateles toxinivorans TaxID=270368 RepID=A0A4R6QT59_9BURK|nr:AAA family ATPase [Roseateles toxinivorans]TDP74744.1 DNA repair exonuclease SbcCD ATPase subunit [Roseateles toxinivorans]
MSMQLTRLRVEQLRQFRQSFELRELTPGLNIFTGPNEGGKSTLVRAIRAAFFERYRSKVVEDLRPRGDSSAMPSVEIDFTLNQQAGRLHKSFLGSRARCSLTLGDRTWDGSDAEDQLATLLGFGYAGKGASKAEHWGIPGLLWVEQGTGQELAEAATHARDHIHTALQERISQSSAGSLAATGGDELLAEFQAQRDELLTSAGKPRAAYQDAITQVQQLQHTLGEVDGRVATYQQQVDQLARLRAQHLQDEQTRPWEPLREQLAVARQTEQALAQGARQLADASAALQQMQRQRELLLEQIQSHERLQVRLAQGRLHCEQAAQVLQQAGEAATLAQRHADEAQVSAEQAHETFAMARQEATRANLQVQWQAASEALDRHQQTLQTFLGSQQQLDELQAQAATCTLTEADVHELRQLERAWQDLTLQRTAVSTRLQFTLQEGQIIALQGSSGAEQLQGQGERLLANPVNLSLPGLGELTITPGGQDLAGLTKDCEAAQAQLQHRLQALGLVDVAQAEAHLSQFQTLLIHIKHARQALKQIVPEGLDRLKERLAQAEGQMQSSQTALAQLPEAPAQPASALEPAELAQQAADSVALRTRSVLADAQQRLARAEVDHQSRGRELELVTEELNNSERQARQQQAQQQLGQLAQDLLVQTALVQECTRVLDQARPDIVQQDIERLSRSVGQLEQAHSQRHTEIQVLDHALQQAGAAGLDEQRQTAAGDLSRASQRVQELLRRAQALSLLCAKLQSRRQAALAKLQAPLRQHLQRYLQLLFPHASVEVGEQLTPDVLLRRTATGAEDVGTFASLSFGAREQLGLISRFAYADLLREAGRPTLLILDDALVHSDGERLGQMKRVLFDAAQRHQVLLFTCHPEDWRDMGVESRALG